MRSSKRHLLAIRGGESRPSFRRSPVCPGIEQPVTRYLLLPGQFSADQLARNAQSCPRPARQSLGTSQPSIGGANRARRGEHGAVAVAIPARATGAMHRPRARKPHVNVH